MSLKCPICGHETNTLYALKSHVIRKHLLNSYCPVCGKKFSKIITHLAQETRKGDLDHAVYYVLYHTANSRRTPETYKRYAPIVVEILERGEVKSR